LAVSYLGRNDLAHVQPEDLAPDTVGRGNEDDEAVSEAISEAMDRVERYASQGYMRSNLMVVNGGKSEAMGESMSAEAMVATPTSVEVGITESVSVEAHVAAATDNRMDAVREAKMKGYEGDACGECGNFTLVRNGTCMKCVTCGATSGCS